MDIWNDKTSLQAGIKRFTLKATVSAILALNAEAVMAVADCPVVITGTDLEGQICNFISNPPSGNSVTVENGGKVGSIQMANYQPTDSYITVNAGGLVSNITGIGIAVTNDSSLSNGLSNNGTIITGSGIEIANSGINGGISNSGLISTVNAGISVNTSTISNGVSNTGEISSASGVGISIFNSTINDGGIFNSVMINAGTTAITIGDNSLIRGDIFNSGTIKSNSAGTGIRIVASTMTGKIFNSGRINGSGNHSGIALLSSSTVSGEITNQGFINAADANAINLDLSQIHGISNSNNGRIESTTYDGIYVGNVSNIADNITNNGLVSGGQNGIFIRSGSTVGRIVNSGTIRGGATGIKISSSAVSGGISNSGIIQGNGVAILIADNPGGNNSIIDIIGQKAQIIGDVDAVGTDVNITYGALFTSEGNYTVKTFNIAPNALFNMANTVTVTDPAGFSNSGTLAVSNSLRTIEGDYTQNTGGVFQTAVSSASNYGRLSVAGAANLDQSGNINVQIAQNASLHAGDVLTNVIEGDTFFRPANGFNVTDNSFIWSFIPGINNTGFNLTLAIDPAAYTVCQGRYCQGAADTIIGQVAAGNSLFSPYMTLSTASAWQAAASQATPELINENIQIIQLITRAVVDIAPMWGNLRGKSSGDAVLYQPGKIWVKPYGGSMTQNERTTVNGFNATVYGTVVGRDIELSNNGLFGGAVAVGGDNIQGKSVLNGQSIHSNAYQGMLYGSKKLPKQFYVAGQGLVGYANNNTSRAIPLYASTAKGSYNSWFTNIRAEAGWSTHTFDPNLVFTPEIDASYLFINQGSYQESGSPMDLSVAANNNSSLVLGAYGNAAYHLTTLKSQHDLTLTGYAGIAGDVINSQPQVTSTFVAGGPSFSTFGVQFNGAVFRGGVGLSLTNQTKPLSVELNYDLQLGNNAYSGIGSATIKYKLI